MLHYDQIARLLVYTVYMNSPVPNIHMLCTCLQQNVSRRWKMKSRKLSGDYKGTYKQLIGNTADKIEAPH